MKAQLTLQPGLADLTEQIKSQCSMKIKKTAADGLLANPMDEVTRNTVGQIADILDRDRPVREGVFKELHARHRENLLTLQRDLGKQNASRLAFSPEAIDTSSAEAKQKALETIRAEINGLQHEVDLNKTKATKLMGNAVWYAKEIGDRLFFVKGSLLGHGKYENWVEENFAGGLSTARAYTRIANIKNWQKIAPKLLSGTLTIEQALALIRKRPKEKKLDARRKHNIRKLKQSFARTIETWSDHKLIEKAHDPGLMGRIAETDAGERISEQLEQMTQRVRFRFAVERQLLNAYVEQTDGSLKPRPLSELI